MAVCSTSNERAVSTIVRVMLGEAVAAKMVREPMKSFKAQLQAQHRR